MSELAIPSQTQAPSAVSAVPSPWQAWWVVGVLSLAGIVSYIDRQVINLLVEPIKADLGVSDVQISLLQGFSFALFYAVLAIPLAWVSDRHNRKMVILLGLICWSAATFASGLAGVFIVLFVARMFIGVGEATLSPAGFSIISDYFSKEKLPGPISVFTGSGFVGSGIALLLGGYLYATLSEMGATTLPFGTFEPWQLTFMCVALLSVPLFFLMLTIREPVRRDGGRAAVQEADAPALEIFDFVDRHKGVFLPLFLGFSCLAGAQYGLGAWAPSYFIRVHEWTQLDVGQMFGPVLMVAGPLGVISGGFAAERLLARGVRDATLRLPLIAALAAIPFALAFPLVSSPLVALALLGMVTFLGTIPFGAGVATFPLITPNRMRAQVMAIYLLIANLLSYSLGPTLIALITDHVFGDEKAINLSLAIAVPCVMAAGAFLILLAIRPYRAMVQSQSNGEPPHHASD
ncbi:MAG: MFS transporter [Pseudomonadota bacterium]